MACTAADINNNGQIAGSCWNWAWDDNPDYLGWYQTDWKACLWELKSSGWSVTVLGTPEEIIRSQAIAINDAGQIYMKTLGEDYTSGSAVWKNGKWTVLYDANGGELEPLDFPRMNERGDVLSRSNDGGLVLWSNGTATEILKYFYYSPSLDNLGRVAGMYWPEDNPHTAFIYKPDSGLQTMPIADVEWLTTINDAGKTLFWRQTSYGTDLLIGELPLGDLATTTTTIGQVDSTRWDDSPLMNANGDILGNVRSYNEQPFYANAAGTGVVLLNGLYEDSRIQANDMNGSGVIVGTSDFIHPLIWGPANESPVLSGLQSLVEAVVGTPIAFTATATDPDGDLLTFGLDGSPTGAAIDPATGEFTWTPMVSGEFTIYVTVTDIHGLSDRKPVTLDVGPAISVGKATISIKGKAVRVEIPLTNRSATSANNVKLTTATLGGVLAGGSFKIGRIASGVTVLCRLSFKNVPSGNSQLDLVGISSLGEFSSTQIVNVP